MGNSGSNFLLSDNKTLNTNAFLGLAEGKGFEKVAGIGEKLPNGESNHCTTLDDNCAGFKAFKDLVGKMEMTVNVNNEGLVKEADVNNLIKQEIGDNYITTKTFKEEFGKFAPEAGAATGSTEIVKRFVSQIQSKINNVEDEVEKANNRVLDEVCEQVTCLNKTDINSWIRGTSDGATSFKSHIRGDVLNNAFNHEIDDGTNWITKIGANLNLQDNKAFMDKLWTGVNAEVAKNIIDKVTENDFNDRMGNYLDSIISTGNHHLNERLAGKEIPGGTIAAYRKPENNKIPDGWLICDGTEGTPDLRGRFIVGAGDMNVNKLLQNDSPVQENLKGLAPDNTLGFDWANYGKSNGSATHKLDFDETPDSKDSRLTILMLAKMEVDQRLDCQILQDPKK